MAKGQKKQKEDAAMELKPYIIKEATIKDGFCNYSFEIRAGLGAGDTHAVKGSGLVKDDMIKAFERLHVHLAAIDDIFKHSDIDIEDIDQYHGDDLTTLYHVTGIKFRGSKDSESVILIGNKYVSSGGRIDLVSPKIPIDNLSSYKWHHELNAAAQACRLEVELYKEGKYDVVEEEDKSDPRQMTIGDEIGANWDDELEKGKV